MLKLTAEALVGMSVSSAPLDLMTAVQTQNLLMTAANVVHVHAYSLKPVNRNQTLNQLVSTYYVEAI